MRNSSILLTLALSAGCTDEECKNHTPLPGQPSYNSCGELITGGSGGTGGTGGSGDTGGSGGSGDSGADETGSLCDQIVEWECSSRAYLAHCNGSTCIFNSANTGTKTPLGCVNVDDLASGAAINLSVPVCGPPAGGQAPTDLCQDACEDLSAADWGLPEQVVISGTTYNSRVWCLPNDQVFTSLGIPGGSASNFAGSCTAITTLPPAEPTTAECGEPTCSGVQTTCGDYSAHGAAITGNNAAGTVWYSMVDHDWSQIIRTNLGSIWACDTGRFHIDDSGPDKFGGLEPGTLLYELGFRKGDTNLKLWRYRAGTFAQQGSKYSVTKMSNALTAYNALYPAAGSDIRIAASVTRGGNTVTIYIEALD